jgi:hypothetical protein
VPLALAAQFLDEFRVERALFEEEWWRSDEAIGPLHLLETIGRLMHAPQVPPADSMEAFFETRLGRAHGATQVAAHEAARVVHLNMTASDRIGEMRNWLRLGGQYWDELHELLQTVPSARHRVSFEAFEPTLRSAWRIAVRWMEHVGIDPAHLGTPVHSRDTPGS